MPRRVDHDTRRRQLADALMRLAAAQGLEAVSLRHVAAEAGVSTGMVQHYFRTKDEMMTFALGVVMERITARATAEAARADQPATPRDAVRSLLLQILPLDETRRREGLVMLAFLAYAAVRPTVATGLRDSNAQLRAHLADQISAAHATAGTTPRIPPPVAATSLLALVDGLGVQVLSQHLSADEAVASLDAQLDVLFGSGP